MNPKYIEVQKRAPNNGYKDCLNRILSEGIYTKNPFQDKGRYTLLTLQPMVFDLPNGFPIITERNIGRFWRKPIGELLAFINGARTVSELKAFGCDWWDMWGTAEKCAQFGLKPGDLGPGSYTLFKNYPAPDGTMFNQFEEIIKQIRDFPLVATHKITTWFPPYAIGHKERQRQVVVAPCHGDIEINILGDGKLYLRMDQRSGDFPIGVPSNIIQYAALTIMIAHVTGYEPYMYIHSVHNAQIYEDQIESIKELTLRKTRNFPTVVLNDEGLKIKNLSDFRPEHFDLSDYNPHPALKIPTTI